MRAKLAARPTEEGHGKTASEICEKTHDCLPVKIGPEKESRPERYKGLNWAELEGSRVHERDLWEAEIQAVDSGQNDATTE